MSGCALNSGIVVVFDMGDAHVYGRGPDGRVNYDESLPWPADWPPYITGRWLRDRGIPWIIA
jgi:hypothetical protein